MKLINNKYHILEKLGSGSFGSIYKGENIRTKEPVAIKVETISNETKLLKNESVIYQHLQTGGSGQGDGGVKGIPKVKWFGKDEINYYMVLDLLGESLQTIKNKRGVFSLTLTLQIGIQIICLLRTIHNKGLLHRDIKPDNFLLGLNDKKQIYIIDFGFCKPFLKNDKHISIKKTNGFIGSFAYASLNAHHFWEQSRRDDLESLGYMLIYFINGSLDWQANHDESVTDKNKKIIWMKERIIENSSIPDVFLNYFRYVRKLSFDEQPNYEMLIDMFLKNMEK
jgi:serine/threonine protein kinase